MSRARSIVLALSLGAGAAWSGCASPPPPAEPAPLAPTGAAAPAREEADPCARAVGETVAGLREPARVELYLHRSVPRVQQLLQGLSRWLEHARTRDRPWIEVQTFDLAEEPARSSAERMGFSPLLKEPSHQIGVRVAYRNANIVHPVMPSSASELVGRIVGLVREARDEADQVQREIGVLSGKREIALSEPSLAVPAPDRRATSPEAIIQGTFPFYRFRKVDLGRGERAIDSDLRVLIITQPGEPFTEAELRRIDELMMSGDRSLLVIAGAVNVEPGTGDMKMQAKLETWGLERLLGGYGIELRRDVILDWRRSLAFPVPNRAGEQIHFRMPSLLQYGSGSGEGSLDGAFPVFFRLPELAIPFASTLVAHPEAQPAARMRVVARSSAGATALTGSTVSLGLSPTWRPEGEMSERAVAITLEGRIRSAFPGAPGRGPIESAGPVRLLAISSAQLFANPFVRAMSPAPGGAADDNESLRTIGEAYMERHLLNTMIVLKNALDWMTMDEHLRACVGESTAR